MKAYSAPGAVRGAMSDYRASAEDVAQDLEDAERKIRCPVLSLWGADFGAVGRLFDMKAIWSEMAENLSSSPDQNAAAIFRRKSNRKPSTGCFSTSRRMGRSNRTARTSNVLRSDK